MSPEQELLAEEDALLRRLRSIAAQGKSCIGVVVQSRREAAKRLERKGLVRTWEGTGPDEGTLLLAWPSPRGSRPGGAAA